MDLRSSKGLDLANFLLRNDLKNFVNEHTRVCRSYYKDKKKFQTSKSLIDVCISNQNKVTSVKVIGCPFSDHKFLVAALDLSRAKHTPFVNIGRSLSEKNLFLIADLIKSQDFSFNKNDQNIDQIWNIWTWRTLIREKEARIMLNNIICLVFFLLFDIIRKVIDTGE